MTRHGERIEDFPLRDSVQTGIEYGLYFEGWRAAAAAGLDLERWENGGYDARFMAKVVAWHRLSGLVEQHSQQAVRAEGERRAKKLRRKK